MKRFRINSIINNSILLRSSFQTIIVPLLLLLINFVLKIRYVSWPSLAMDEPFSVYHSQFDITTIINELSQGNNPPLFEIFLHFWTKLFGISEFSVRFPSVFFSSLSVFFIYRICHKFFNLKTAILASLLFTLSNYQIYFAQEARVYPLFMLLTIVSMYQYMKLITPRYSKTDGVIFIIINILLLYSHFFSWFVLFLQGFVLIVTNRGKNSELFRFLKYFIIILLGYLPYASVFIMRFLDSSKGTWVEPVENLRPLHSFYGSLINESHVSYIVVLILFWIILQRYIILYFKNKMVKGSLIMLSTVFVLISISFRLPLFPSYLFDLDNNFSSNIEIISFLLFYLGIFIHYLTNKNRARHEKIILSWFFVPGFVMFVSSFYIPMFIDRYLIFFTPAFFIILSIIVNKMDNKLYFSFSLILILLMVITVKPTSNNHRDIRTLVEKVKELHTDSSSAVFICPPHFRETFTYYFNRELFTNIKNGIPYTDMINSLNSEHIYFVRDYKTIDTIRNSNNYNKIIFIDAAADFSYPNNDIKEYLNRQFQGESSSIDSIHVPSIFNIYSFKSLN